MGNMTCCTDVNPTSLNSNHPPQHPSWYQLNFHSVDQQKPQQRVMVKNIGDQKTIYQIQDNEGQVSLIKVHNTYLTKKEYEEQLKIQNIINQSLQSSCNKENIAK